MAIIPQDVAFESARQELIACINYCLKEPLNIKPYEMEMLLYDLHNEVYQAAQQQLANNKKAYDEAVKAEQSEQSVFVPTEEEAIVVDAEEDNQKE